MKPSSVSTPAQDVADRWPLGCHSPNSCSSHGRCMYVGCKHDGKDIAALATAFTPNPRRAPASVATPAQDATALIERLGITVKNLLGIGYTNAAINVQDAIEALRATSQTPDAVAWLVTAGDNSERHLFFDKCEAKKMFIELDENGWIDTVMLPLAHPQPQQADDQ